MYKGGTIDAKVSVSVSGGTGPYSWTMDLANGFYGSGSSSSASFTASVSYCDAYYGEAQSGTVSVTDSAGDTGQASFTMPPSLGQVGLEVWDKTSGADESVDSAGLTSSPTIDVNPQDSVIFKQPAGTALTAGARVDIYNGEYGQPGTYLATAYANSEGYWEWDGFSGGFPRSYIGTESRYFVFVDDARYSDGIIVFVEGIQ